MPLVPMRRNANGQYSILNIVPPMAMAAIYTTLPIFPTIATSIIPNRGVVIFAIIAGMDSASISL